MEAARPMPNLCKPSTPRSSSAAVGVINYDRAAGAFLDQPALLRSAEMARFRDDQLRTILAGPSSAFPGGGRPHAKRTDSEAGPFPRQTIVR